MAMRRELPVNDAIRQAVKRLLETGSLEDLRVADILADAGVSRAAFYGLYPNKAAAVAALAREWLEDILPVAEDTFGSREPLEPDVLVELVSGWLEALYPHRALGRALLDGRMRYPELADVHREAFARLRKLIPADPPLAAAFLCVVEVALNGYLSGAPDLTDPRKVSEALVAMFVGARRRDTPAAPRRRRTRTKR